MQFVSDAFKIESSSSRPSNGYHIETDIHEEDDELEGACALPLLENDKKENRSGLEDVLQLETSKILELFPNYGVGYIRRLLAFYNNSSENVVSKILEG